MRIVWRWRWSRRGAGRGARIAVSVAIGVWDRRVRQGPRSGGVGPAHDVGVAASAVGCDNCEERRLEEHGRFQGSLTRRFSRRLVEDARMMSISPDFLCRGLNE